MRQVKVEYDDFLFFVDCADDLAAIRRVIKSDLADENKLKVIAILLDED